MNAHVPTSVGSMCSGAVVASVEWNAYTDCRRQREERRVAVATSAADRCVTPEAGRRSLTLRGDH